MRKSISILFLIAYALVSSGLNINIHFCAGKIVSLEINGVPDYCVTEGGTCESSHDTCCDDQSIVLENGNWQVASKLPLYQTLEFVFSTFSLQDLRSFKNPSPLFSFIQVEFPPPLSLWLLFQKIIYYG